MNSETEQPDSIANSFAQSVAENVTLALTEDVGTGDITAALVNPSTQAGAEVITRDQGIFCGAPWIIETCRQVDHAITVTLHISEGETMATGDTLFSLRGAAASLLTAERTILNFVQLLSATATSTRAYVDLIKHTDATILDTRKTIPGLRHAQKYAVRCGGGQNHRMGLYDAFLIKENHISACGGITEAITSARNNHSDLSIEIEVESLDQLREAMAANVDMVMLDNFNLRTTAEAVALVAGKIKLEASGGVNKNTLVAIAATGVDYISVGELTKTITPIDLSMCFTE